VTDPAAVSIAVKEPVMASNLICVSLDTKNLFQNQKELIQ